jgi:hypothetical protein
MLHNDRVERKMRGMDAVAEVRAMVYEESKGRACMSRKADGSSGPEFRFRGNLSLPPSPHPHCHTTGCLFLIVIYCPSYVQNGLMSHKYVCFSNTR